MLRAFCFSIMVAIAAPAFAMDETATIGAGDTAQMTIGDTQAIAFYTTDRKGMQLTMVFTDSEGEMLRTRVRLDEGQTHTIVLDAGDEAETENRYTFRRHGNTVEMGGETVALQTTLAARY